MSHQFKSGDLALIVRGPNTGNCVECIAFLRPGEMVGGFEGYQGGPELGNMSHESAWIVRFANLDVALERPRDLMPLRGDFTPDQQKAKEAEPCA
ncbi:hypothetical protein [Pseudomonas viridiflava]|uniref:hypothetical protein n=1 Tax=Pseudomonas viridiflava TaxID=33069 RepID=UPI001C3133E5|nr:hypothetical protein [Pseudomonas viridiflava]QXG49200.1 hypothetical protein KTT57_09360 [Pseudomonas viridiflava]